MTPDQRTQLAGLAAEMRAYLLHHPEALRLLHTWAMTIEALVADDYLRAPRDR